MILNLKKNSFHTALQALSLESDDNDWIINSGTS